LNLNEINLFCIFSLKSKVSCTRRLFKFRAGGGQCTRRLFKFRAEGGNPVGVLDYKEGYILGRGVGVDLLLQGIKLALTQPYL